MADERPEAQRRDQQDHGGQSQDTGEGEPEGDTGALGGCMLHCDPPQSKGESDSQTVSARCGCVINEGGHQGKPQTGEGSCEGWQATERDAVDQGEGDQGSSKGREANEMRGGNPSRVVKVA